MPKMRLTPTGLRLPAELHAKLSEEAERREVSLSAEMQRRLAASFDLDELIAALFEQPVEELFRILKDPRLLALVLRPRDDVTWERKPAKKGARHAR